MIVWSRSTSSFQKPLVTTSGWRSRMLWVEVGPLMLAVMGGRAFQWLHILEFLRHVGQQATERHAWESSDFREVGVCAKGDDALCMTRSSPFPSRCPQLPFSLCPTNSSPRDNSPSERQPSQGGFWSLDSDVPEILGFLSYSTFHFPDGKTCSFSGCHHCQWQLMPMYGSGVMVLITWTWQDSQRRVAWSLESSGWGGQELPVGDLVDVSYHLKDMPLVG